MRLFIYFDLCYARMSKRNKRKKGKKRKKNRHLSILLLICKNLLNGTNTEKRKSKKINRAYKSNHQHIGEHKSIKR